MAWLNEYRKYLSESDSLKNAQLVINHLYTNDKDWSKESISALLGNMWKESTVNPNMYEHGYSWEQDRGFGLVQWTPRSKYWDWALQNGYSENELRNGNAQLDRLDYEVKNNIQWIAKESVFNKLTFKEFRTNAKKLTIDELVEAFMWGYERPNREAGIKSLPERIAYAKKCYKDLKWSEKESNEDIIEEKPDYTPIKDGFKDFNENFSEYLDKLLTKNIYFHANDNKIANKYITINKLMNNMYQVKLNNFFIETVKDIIKNGVDSLDDFLDDNLTPVPPSDSNEEPEPPEKDPNNKKFFPVDYKRSGINFWHPPHDSNLKKNMDYGMRTSGRFHNGYDIGGGGRNHPIHSVADGEIILIKNISGYGYSMQVKQDDGYYSFYAHLVTNSSTKKRGERVKAGERIATMGATGGNYAIHLHYELTKNGKIGDRNSTIDPKNYLGITKSNFTSLARP